MILTLNDSPYPAVDTLEKRSMSVRVRPIAGYEPTEVGADRTRVLH